MESSESSLIFSLSYSSSAFERSDNSTWKDASDRAEPMASDFPEESSMDESLDNQQQSLLNIDWYVAIAGYCC